MSEIKVDSLTSVDGTVTIGVKELVDELNALKLKTQDLEDHAFVYNGNGSGTLDWNDLVVAGHYSLADLADLPNAPTSGTVSGSLLVSGSNNSANRVMQIFTNESTGVTHIRTTTWSGVWSTWKAATA